MSNPIIEFWFSAAVRKKRFKKDARFDSLIAARFEQTLTDALAGKYDAWQERATDCLALVILYDQFPRNMYRDTARAFAYDDHALRTATHALAQKFDRTLTQDQRAFLYMPFMHSEHITAQTQSVTLFTALGSKMTLKYAQAHHDIIARFGRFPHRNKILGRTSTQEELKFLKTSGSSF